MNHWFWNKKHKDQNAIIHNDCHQKLSANLRKQFTPAPQISQVTHTVQIHDDDFMLSPLNDPLTMWVMEEAITHHTDAVTGEPFGGGSGNGAGATSDYSPSQNIIDPAPQPDPGFNALPDYNTDSQPAYDPGPSVDSTN